MLEHFKVSYYRLELIAGKYGLLLPPYKGSTFRGGFGTAFRKITCAQSHTACQPCILKQQCPYTYIFETAPPEDTQALRKYESIPRPFILEPPMETKTEYQPGERISFGLVLVGRAIEYLPYFILAFKELGELGIGKGRRPFQLDKIVAVNPIDNTEQEVYQANTGKVHNHNLTLTGKTFNRDFNLKPDNQLTIHYLTMTRVKHGDHFIRYLEFHMLIRALLRRLSSILYFHHGLEWEADFRALIDKAETVDRIKDTTRWVNWERYSNRQETKMRLGGLVGQVTYQGEFREFMPILKLGELIHVGKAATFGMGKYQMLL